MANKDKGGEKLKPKADPAIKVGEKAVLDAVQKGKQKKEETSSGDKGTTKVIICTCTSKFQDITYGLQKRVHNFAPKQGNGSWRCTVCKLVRAN